MAKITSTAALAALTRQLYRVWARTLTYEQEGYSAVGAYRSRGHIVFALWHDELFAPCHLHRNEGIIALVSPVDISPETVRFFLMDTSFPFYTRPSSIS